MYMHDDCHMNLDEWLCFSQHWGTALLTALKFRSFQACKLAAQRFDPWRRTQIFEHSCAAVTLYYPQSHDESQFSDPFQCAMFNNGLKFSRLGQSHQSQKQLCRNQWNFIHFVCQPKAVLVWLKFTRMKHGIIIISCKA